MTSVSTSTWTYDNLVASKEDTCIPSEIIRIILKKIHMNESRFTITEQTVTLGVIQSNLNKISKSNVNEIAVKFAEFITDKKHANWILSHFIKSCAKQYLFREQYVVIIEAMLKQMKTHLRTTRRKTFYH